MLALEATGLLTKEVKSVGLMLVDDHNGFFDLIRLNIVHSTEPLAGGGEVCIKLL